MSKKDSIDELCLDDEPKNRDYVYKEDEEVGE